MADDNLNKNYNQPEQNIQPDPQPQQDYQEPSTQTQPQQDYQEAQQQTPPQQGYQTPPQQNYQTPPQQQYYNPQQNYQMPPQQPYYQPPVQDKANVGLAILSYIIPLAGLIIYLTQKDTKPKNAKVCGKCALASVIINVVLTIILYVIMGSALFAGLSAANDYASDYSYDDYSYYDSYDDETEDRDNSQAEIVETGATVTTDYFNITYVSCNADYTDYDEYSEPTSGNKVIRAEFDIENISDSDYSIDGIECYADNAKCDTYIWADDYANPVFESVSPGRTLKAVIYYEVPQGAQNIEIEMETNLWAEEKVIFNVK